jgi:hypothetical protein
MKSMIKEVREIIHSKILGKCKLDLLGESQNSNHWIGVATVFPIKTER